MCPLTAPRVAFPHPGQQLQGDPGPPAPPISYQRQQLDSAAGPRAEPCPPPHRPRRWPCSRRPPAVAPAPWACCTARCSGDCSTYGCGVHITVALGRGGHGLPTQGPMGGPDTPVRSPGDSVHTSWMRTCATSPWLLKAARCSAVNPSSFLASTSCRAHDPPDSSVGAGRCLWGQG